MKLYPDDVVCIEKVYQLLFFFRRPPCIYFKKTHNVQTYLSMQASNLGRGQLGLDYGLGLNILVLFPTLYNTAVK